MTEPGYILEEIERRDTSLQEIKQDRLYSLRKKDFLLVLIVPYLIAIIAANLLVAWLGSWVTPINALVFIPFNLTSKDSLQRRWGFDWRMIALIFAGSCLSVLFSLSAWRIALASFAAFLLAGIGDALVFERLKARGWLWQVNGSNVAGATLDSALFLILAFGWPPVWGALGLQIVAKIFGGLFWSLVLSRSDD